MSLNHDDILRAARSLVADFGEEAEAEVERRIGRCTNAESSYTAFLWRQVGTAVSELRATDAIEVDAMPLASSSIKRD